MCHDSNTQNIISGISGSSAKSANANTKFYVESSWNNNGQLSRGGSSGIASLSPSSSSAGTISPPNLKQDQIKHSINLSSVITSKPQQTLNCSPDQQKYHTQQRKKSSVTRPTEAPPAPPKTFNLTSDGNEENLDSTSYNKVHQHSPGMSSKHESLLSSVLVPKINRINTEVTDDDVPPPLPTTSPPKLTPESTLTWKHKERMPLKLDLPNSGLNFQL
jgi:hypothetical protein